MRRVILLAATEMEAQPVRAALTDVERIFIATKAFYVGTASPEVAVVLAVSGCDKANAAHVLTSLLQTDVSSSVVGGAVGRAGCSAPGGVGAASG